VAARFISILHTLAISSSRISSTPARKELTQAIIRKCSKILSDSQRVSTENARSDIEMIMPTRTVVLRTIILLLGLLLIYAAGRAITAQLVRPRLSDSGIDLIRRLATSEDPGLAEVLDRSVVYIPAGFVNYYFASQTDFGWGRLCRPASSKCGSVRQPARRLKPG
jgi:hypothetical protein